jgi:excisionase family DNA binding protein
VSPPLALPALTTLPEHLLTGGEVAATLGVCRATVYKLCERGELPHVRISNAIRFKSGAAEAFIAAKTGQPPRTQPSQRLLPCPS